MKRYYFIHLLILFISGNPLAAQETDLKFQYLGGSRGLTTNPVTCILQDRPGFMWFGTYEGLQRFDGYQCRTFRQRPDEQKTLSDNYITCFFASRKRKFVLFVKIFVPRVLRPVVCLLAISTSILPNLNFAQNTHTLHVIYPPEGAKIFSSDSMFVLGNFSGKYSHIAVNGLKAKIYRNNTFVAMIPLRPDSFLIDIKAIAARDTLFVKRNVYVPPHYLENSRKSLVIDTSFFRVFEGTEIRQGEKMAFFVKGTPGARATFSLPGIVQNVRMKALHPRRSYRWDGSVFKHGKPPALPKIHGIYAGAFTFSEKTPLGKASLQFTLKKSNGDTVTASPDAAIFLRKNNFKRTAFIEYETVITDENTTDQFTPVFFPPGARISVTGRIGNFYRVSLGKTDELWVPGDRIRFRESVPRKKIAIISRANVESFVDKLQIRLQQTQRVPFRIIQDTQPQRLSLFFYGARFDSTLSEIEIDERLLSKNVWQQVEENVARATFFLNLKQQWGYRAFYEETTFVLEIKRPPKIGKTSKSLLQNLVVCVDPGHNPDDGSIGPTGLKEKDATSNYAGRLKKMLERRGAKVILTRWPLNGINLSSRAMFADQANADLFISLHFNALPDGVNPLRSRGTSTYYYHQQSHALADAVQKKLLSKTRLPDFGLHQNDLAVCRITSMPAVLIEPAFIMIPHEEMKILDPGFQKKVCEGIVQGIEDFLTNARE